MSLQDQSGVNQGKGQAGVNPERLQNVEMALEALRNVIRNNPGGWVPEPHCWAADALFPMYILCCI